GGLGVPSSNLGAPTTTWLVELSPTFQSFDRRFGLLALWVSEIEICRTLRPGTYFCRSSDKSFFMSEKVMSDPEITLDKIRLRGKDAIRAGRMGVAIAYFLVGG